MVEIAYASGEAAQAAAQGGGFWNNPLFPIILMIGVMWFLLIRPQQKKQKEHKEMLGNLKKGDRIITSGGIHGRITAVVENTLTVEIADKVRVKVSRSHVAGLAQAGAQKSAQPKKKSESDKK